MCDFKYSVGDIEFDESSKIMKIFYSSESFSFVSGIVQDEDNMDDILMSFSEKFSEKFALVINDDKEINELVNIKINSIKRKILSTVFNFIQTYNFEDKECITVHINCEDKTSYYPDTDYETRLYKRTKKINISSTYCFR